jgi:hypothetical protein
VGLCLSALIDWRRHRNVSAYETLKAIKRRLEHARPHPLAAEQAQLLRDNRRLTLRLRRTEAVSDIPKRAASLLGNPFPTQEAP